jgi:signal transduction histidine kinase
MRLSYRIPFITGIFLLLTAIVNIAAFQVLSEKYFHIYISEISSGDTTPDPSSIKVLLQIGRLGTTDQAEYTTILWELANLSTSIENIGENPELYMSSSPYASWGSMISLPSISQNSSLPSFFDLSALGKDTSEGRFVANILKGIIFVNFLWLSMILLGYFLWVRSIFRPIRTVTDTIQSIIDKKRYATILYKEKNEFSPLISTINNLHKSLSIQEKIRSDFLSDLSHEIRTPITAVKCYLEAIQDGAMKLDTKTVDLLHSELTRLTDITGKIMDYESLTHDVFSSVKVERFSLRRITEEIIHEYEPQLEKWSQSIVLDLPTDTMTSMDKGMYIQILHNIFSNFIKYAWEHTVLQITYQKKTDSYTITFSDNGMGIPPDEIAFVTEKFYRVDKARTGSDKSMGIGLSLVDRIARLHRGGLTVEKNTPKGVKFIVKVGR